MSFHICVYLNLFFLQHADDKNFNTLCIILHPMFFQLNLND